MLGTVYDNSMTILLAYGDFQEKDKIVSVIKHLWTFFNNHKKGRPGRPFGLHKNDCLEMGFALQ